MLPSPLPPGRPSLEVADVFRGEAASFLRNFGPSLSSQQKRVFSAIQVCRTAVLGGHVRACDDCEHHEISYNSCRNRHCPKCQAMARAKWLKQREAELLPIPYFHVVFTLTVQWDPYVGKDSQRYEYRVYRSTRSGFPLEDATPVFSTRAAHSYKDGAVERGQTYYYRAAACRDGRIVSCSWEASNTAEAVPKPQDGR